VPTSQISSRLFWISLRYPLATLCEWRALDSTAAATAGLPPVAALMAACASSAAPPAMANRGVS
jgi:hypothetical protein